MRAAFAAAAEPGSAAAHGGAAVLEPFEQWAARNRRRAARDGAWRIECSERVNREGGGVARSITTWHDTERRAQRAQRREVPVRQRQQRPPSRRAMGTQQPQQTARQRRSARRSATHHKLLDEAADAQRAAAPDTGLPGDSTNAPRAVGSPPSPIKRRRSPPPEEQLLLTGSAADALQAARAAAGDDAASTPPPHKSPRSPGVNLGAR